MSARIDVDATVALLETELRERADEKRAEGSRAYLKSDLDFIGVSVPDMRAVVRAFSATQALDRTSVIRLAQALWDAPSFERKLTAVLLLERYVRLLEPHDLEVVESLIRGSQTWALVDPLSSSVAGTLLQAHPDALDVLDRWARDESFWIRRSALLALLKPIKQGESFDRFGRYADEMLEEREFFIRKAIGWILREAAKKDPRLVADWVRPRIERISGVTLREAVKYLDPADKEELLHLYRARGTGSLGG